MTLTVGSIRNLTQDQFVGDFEQHLERDMTDHPEHYTNRKMECWDWYEKAMTPEEFVGAMKNNIWRYTYRCGYKDDAIQDLTKAIRYLERWIRFIKEREE